MTATIECIARMKCFNFLLIIFSLLIAGCNSHVQRGLNDYYGKNYQSAYDRFSSCARLGDSACMNNIGMMYENGAMQGGADIEKAVQWYTLSARHGQPVAQQNLIRLGRTVPAVDLVTAQQQDNTGAAILAAGLLGAAVANTNRPSTTNTTIVTPPPTQKTPINCTSTEVFGSVQTTCR